ncbi:copper transporter [Solicola gregarius]|uniref:Copper transporter n=1 Tax=Solicola gregarius TaxID=2908642 RepID=A0AA46THC5_9ACTN|nr:copper transporter [Solicola gregarius]UYM05193.1 copper transporter [Solicola gregarius]
MIDFRYHLISIIAIFLALAAGVALGAGPLDEPFSEQLASEADKDRQDKADLREQLDEADDVRGFQDAFAQQVGSDLLSGALQDRTVALFVLPGADDDAAKGLTDEIEAAGGSVTTTVNVSDKMIDPSEQQFAEGVARQSLDGQNGAPDTSGMSSYQLLGTALARAYLGDGSDTKFDSTSGTIASAYKEAGFVETSAEPTGRASLALFVVPGADDMEDNQDELVSTVASAADAASSGAVVAGPPASAADGGVVAYVRSNDVGETVSTVDAVNVAAGQIVTALALQREAGGKSGHYGAEDGAAQAMPGNN